VVVIKTLRGCHWPVCCGTGVLGAATDEEKLVRSARAG
jgi:hypothetical protein